MLRRVLEYAGPEDSDFPGCVAVPMTPEQFESYNGDLKIEYWSRAEGTAWIVRDLPSPDHEHPGSILSGLVTRISQERGSPIRCCGTPRMDLEDSAGETVESTAPDQCVYLNPGAFLPSGKASVLGRDPHPDVVLEVDHTTDIRRRKLDIYRRLGYPEVWAETPDAPSASRPRGVAPGLTIYLLEAGRYRKATESVAFPTWRRVRSTSP